MPKSTSLDSVLGQAAKDGCCIGWVYTPRKAYFIRRDDDLDAPWLRLEPLSEGYHEVEEDFSAVYEVVLFSPSTQHHWTNKSDNEGTHGSMSEPSTTFQDIELHLWGKITSDSGLEDLPWTKLASARTGELLVPIKADPKDRYIVLKQRNYLHEDSYGNVYVKASRYTGFRSTNGTKVK